MQAGKYGEQSNTAAGPKSFADFGSAASDPGPAIAAVSPLEAEARVLKRLGISKPWIARMAARAAAHGTTIERELLFGGGLQECAYYAGLARLVGLPYLDEIAPERVVSRPGLDSQLRCPTMIRLSDAHRPPITVIAPGAQRLADLEDSIARLPALRATLAIASPSSIRRAVWQAGALLRVQATIQALFDTAPDLSARIVLAGRQGFYLGILLSATIALFAWSPRLATSLFHILMSSTYLAALLLRAAALLPARRAKTCAPPHMAQGCGPLPIYSVMVALYRESAVAEQLIKALNRLDWPHACLDIKLVCEADDVQTIAAIRGVALGPQYEIIEVPAMAPRTKPKALTYALTGVRGDYVAIYDAEDRPHPAQLREAHARFVSGPGDVACLQAPLIISNAGESWISALFSLEYSALFRRLLPALARYRMPLPLGGTSNHFRTDALRAVGGWDPFNVTEDADLGMRLYRFGYRSDVILRQTLEDAPTSSRVWFGQRTRWFKGWLQTWLVMMRNPAVTRREMGMRGFLVFQLLIGGMLISSLSHPAILLFFVLSASAMAQSPAPDVAVLDAVLLAVDITNIFGSYALFLVMGTSAMIEHERRLIGRRWIAIPLYWMMVSLSAWRAVLELRSNPFFWKKTPHRPSADKPGG